jgi:hypothetical protein
LNLDQSGSDTPQRKPIASLDTVLRAGLKSKTGAAADDPVQCCSVVR